MSIPKPLSLADLLGSALSLNALLHLRAARIARLPERTTPRESLRAELLLRGFPAAEPLLDVEERTGGAAFPDGRFLGVHCFLSAGSWLRPRDLPQLDGGPALPIYGDPDQIAEDWEAPFHVMSASGAIGVFAAPAPPAPAYASLQQLLEVEALAPLSSALHVLRGDALCGELLADLVGATPHPPATAERAFGFVGDRVWVKELRIAPAKPAGWSSFHGTFLMSEQLDPLVDAMSLLREEGYALGHRGPTAEPAEGSEKVLAFVDANPELGYRAQVEVTVWRGEEGYAVTRRVAG